IRREMHSGTACGEVPSVVFFTLGSHVASSLFLSHLGRHLAPRCAMLIVPGRAALSAARQARALARGQTAGPGLGGLSARWMHLVATTRPLTAAEATQLDEMLAYGPSDAGPAVPESGPGVETLAFFVAPRLGTTSPWSSKATDIAHVCGLPA